MKKAPNQAAAAGETATETTAKQPGTDIALLPPAERAVIVLDSTKAEQQLKAMLTETADITEVKDKDSRTQAHNAAMKLKNARIAIEKTGKGARDDANAFSKAVIAEEKRLTAIITDEEDRLFKLRDTYDQQVEAERLERERKEKERVDGITSQIEAIKALPMDSSNDTADQLHQTIHDLTDFVIGDDFAEFKEQAEAAKQEAIEALKLLWNSAQAREQQAAALAEERKKLDAECAELEALRAQLEAQQAAAAPAPAVATDPEPEQEQEPGLFSGVDMAAGESQSVKFTFAKPVAEEPEPFAQAEPVEQVQASEEPALQLLPKTADDFAAELAKYTAMQFDGLAEKVSIVAAGVNVPELRDGFTDFAIQLRNVSANLKGGHFNDALVNSDWNALGMADKAIALASHAGVALVFGEQEMGGSVLMEAAE